MEIPETMRFKITLWLVLAYRAENRMMNLNDFQTLNKKGNFLDKNIGEFGINIMKLCEMSMATLCIIVIVFLGVFFQTRLYCEQCIPGKLFSQTVCIIHQLLIDEPD